MRAANKDMVRFISSLEDDKRIANSTVLVNEAHVIALVKSGVIPRTKGRKILRALVQLEGRPIPDQELEDIHVFIEEYVIRRAGPNVGGLLHLGKSRNDQVTTAIRITLREDLLDLSSSLLALENELLRLASKHTESVFPGYTHLQPAQPISFAHYLVANGDSLLRNNQRIVEAYRRVNCSPMGAAALAGTSFPLDRALIASMLGFDGLVEVSLDAVGSRDFALEILCVCALIASDLSRIAQDFIFYSSAEACLITLPDEFASTSSIMPQKKNPDPLELVRAKCAKIIGILGSSATTLHGLPSGYNLDFQEITPQLWHAIDELKSCLQVMIALVPGIRVDSMIAQRRYLEFTAATELANVLVRAEKMPFRLAHRAVGSAVRDALRQSKTLKDLRHADWEKYLNKQISPRTFSLMIRTLDLSKHLHVYRSKGSPNPEEMRRAISRRRLESGTLLKANSRLRESIHKSFRTLHKLAISI